MTDNSTTAFRGPSKARVTLRRDYQDGKPLPLRRTPHIVQVEITRALDGGFRVQAASAPSFVVGEFQLRRWPAFQRRLEAAIGCRVQAMARAEWACDLATNNLAAWTNAARAYAAANEAWFDEAFEQHCLWMQGVADDMARPRAERRRA